MLALRGRGKMVVDPATPPPSNPVRAPRSHPAVPFMKDRAEGMDYAKAASFLRSDAPSTTAANCLLPVAACCLLILLVSWDWIGYVGSDDAIYWSGAKGWLEHFPYVGGHGSIRETISIPIALSIAVLGNSSVALALPTLLCTLSLIALLAGWVNRAAGPTAAVLTAVFLATSPLLVTDASVAS